MDKLKTVVDFVKYIISRYQEDGCQQSAAALTYMSLFAVVPLMTVTFTMFSLVPSFSGVGEQVQDLIFENLLPSSGSDVKDYLTDFTSQARKLTFVGVAFLGGTAFLMLKNIEKTLNNIWHANGNRKGLSSFMLYWAVLSLGPLMLGVAFLMSTYLVSYALLIDKQGGLGLVEPLLQLAPIILQGAAFSMVFATVPNTHVNTRHALIGGLTTAIVFDLAKSLFTGIVANTSHAIVYGAFAAVPLFLMWIYLTWLIILGGAVFTHALSSYQYRDSNEYAPVLTAVTLLEFFYRRHQQGRTIDEQEILGSKWMLNKQAISSKQWKQLRDIFTRAKLIHQTEGGEFILGKDLDQVSLYQLSTLIPLPASYRRAKTATNHEPPWFKAVSEKLVDIDATQRDIMATPLEDLFSQSEVEIETKVQAAL
jgi:membrane protein